MKKSLRSVNMRLAIALFIGSCLLYSNSLVNEFVYDDEYIIVENSFIKKLSNIPRLFSDTYFTGSQEINYRPFSTLSYMVVYAVCKLNPVGFHLSSILIHAGCVLLIFGIALALTASSGTAFISALLFLAHPALTEAVNGVSFNEDLICTFFFLLALYCYSKKPRFGVLFVAVFYASGLLTKEMAITFPLVVLVYDLIWGRGATFAEKLRKNIGYYIAILIVTAFYLVLRFWIFKAPAEDTVVVYGSLIERIIYVPYILVWNLWLAIAPLNLSVDHVFKYPGSFFSVVNLLSVAICWMGAMVTVLMIRKRWFFALFGVLWFFIALLPVTNIIQIGNPIAERYLYLPMVGFALCIGALLHSLVQNKKLQKFSYALIILIISLYATRTFARNFDWKNGLTLWSSNVKTSPQSYTSHCNYGIALLQNQQSSEGIDALNKSLQINPENSAAYKIIGNYYLDHSQNDSAILLYHRALSVDSMDYETGHNLSVAYSNIRRFDDALKAINRAIMTNPEYDELYFTRALTYQNMGRNDAAINDYQKAIALDPDNFKAYANLGIVYLISQKPVEAQEAFKKALQLEPDNEQLRKLYETARGQAGGVGGRHQ